MVISDLCAILSTLLRPTKKAGGHGVTILIEARYMERRLILVRKGNREGLASKGARTPGTLSGVRGLGRHPLPCCCHACFLYGLRPRPSVPARYGEVHLYLAPAAWRRGRVATPLKIYHERLEVSGNWLHSRHCTGRQAPGLHQGASDMGGCPGRIWRHRV